MFRATDVLSVEPIGVSQPSENLTLDLDFGNDFIVNLDKNINLDVKNMAFNCDYRIIFKQDVTGGHTITLSDKFRLADDEEFTPVTTTEAICHMYCYSDGKEMFFGSARNWSKPS